VKFEGLNSLFFGVIVYKDRCFLPFQLFLLSSTPLLKNHLVFFDISSSIIGLPSSSSSISSIIISRLHHHQQLLFIMRTPSSTMRSAFLPCAQQLFDASLAFAH
jgi:hypothetical protein